MRTQVLFVVSAALAAASAAMSAHEEVEIAIDQVPDAVMAAARTAHPGMAFTEAEYVRGAGSEYYELEGEAGDTEIEMLIAPDGRILEQQADD